MFRQTRILASFPNLVSRSGNRTAAVSLHLSSPLLSLPSLSSPPLHMEDPSLSSPIGDGTLVPDPGAPIGSASGSLKSEGLLSGAASADDSGDAEFGFQRSEMGRGTLVGTVGLYERHVFLCYKSPDVWPSHVEAAEFDRLPRLLSAALAARKADLKKRTRLTICEGEDGTESSNGDILIFPDMIRYRRLTHFDVDNFVEEVLVKDTDWLPGAAETMAGSHVFVCAHGSRDRRCGVCGPVLIKKIKEEINSRGLQDQVFVSPCSHIGGHKYAGNVIIFSPNVKGEVTGHWYGYVTPDDVPTLLERHIGKGEIIDHLWRGQMGLSEEDQKAALKLRADGAANSLTNGTAGCCQGVGNSSCCQNTPPKKNLENNHIGELENEGIVQKSNGEEDKAGSSKGAGPRKTRGIPTWFESWEREDTYAALAVVAAVASVAVAYSCYRQLK